MGKTQSIFSRPATRRGSQNRDRQRDANSQQTSSTRPTSVETNTVNSGISRQSTTASVAPPGPETNTDSRVNPILVNRPSNSYPSVSKATSLQKVPSISKASRVQNLMHIQKDSLKIIQIADRPHCFCLSFRVDTLIACNVQIAFVAQEVNSISEYPCQRRFESIYEWIPTEVVRFEKGLGQVYTQQPDSALDVTSLRLSDIFLCKNTSFTPVILHIEPAEKVGAEDNMCANSSTLYCSFIADEKGISGISAVRQEIEIQGKRFDLVDIYGYHAANNILQTLNLETANEATENEDDPIEDYCVICMSSVRNTIVLPCRHVCFCLPCSFDFRKKTQKCPICRTPVESMMHFPST
eukprot:TRINITY_DN749_c0_g1_i6.p1 TRINITY_DN749_c0_g1~~TRINITY_DN749_c0_g1_i6.p1  ORF type:complete len:353 (+),score=45.30 TRINITY_DN749_c0_g1_i6:54-1112(+)